MLMDLLETVIGMYDSLRAFKRGILYYWCPLLFPFCVIPLDLLVILGKYIFHDIILLLEEADNMDMEPTRKIGHPRRLF